MKLWFTCSDCGKKQQLDVGDVHVVASLETITDPDKILYENEVRCKSCASLSLELQPLEYPTLVLRKAFSLDKGEVSIGDTGGAEDKFMPFSEVKPYIERRIQEEPENGELRLRYANILRKFNLYDEAIAEYEKASQLNSNLLSPLVNLCDIFYHRSKQYREKGAITKAKKYFERAVALYKSGNADLATVLNKEIVPAWIVGREFELCKGKRKSRKK